MPFLNRTSTWGSNQEILGAGDSVICTNAIIGPESDIFSDFDLKQGEEYEIESIHDEDHFIAPMVILKGSQHGPYFANRFVSQSERVALDSGSNILKKGDTVVCLDDTSQGDTGSEFDLKKGQRYTVDGIHDEDHLTAPMVLLLGSCSGPVFPNRFKKVIRI